MAISRISSGVLIINSSGRRKTTPITEITKPSAVSKIKELVMVLTSSLCCWAPKYWETRMVVAMVMPLTMAINAKITGKPTETDANALAPRKRPTQMLSTVLYNAAAG